MKTVELKLDSIETIRYELTQKQFKLKDAKKSLLKKIAKIDKEISAIDDIIGELPLPF